MPLVSFVSLVVFRLALRKVSEEERCPVNGSRGWSCC